MKYNYSNINNTEKGMKMANFLVADDAKIMRMNLGKMLTELGHNVIAEAKDGNEAITLYKKHQEEIDIVTMDITMPEVNGIEDGIMAAKEIIKVNPTAKIIMVTSHSDQRKVLEAIKAGAANYLVKPIKKTKLEEVIDKVGIK